MRGFLILLVVGAVVQTASAQNGPGSAGASGTGRGGRGGGGGRAAGAAAGGGGGRQLSKLIEGPDLGYKPVVNPLPMPPGLGYGAVAGVTINSKGHVFVYMGVRPAQKEMNVAYGPLVEFNADGSFVRAFGQELNVSSPHGFRLDPADNFWVTDIGDHTVSKLNPQGKILFTLGTKGKSGVWDEATGAHLLEQPTDVAIAPNGDVFVGQGHGNSGYPAILKFDKTGQFLTAWSGKVEGPAAFTNVHAIVLDPDGNIWVGDRAAKKVLIFNGEGKYLRSIQMPVYVCGFYVAKGNQLYMTSGWDGQILKMDWEGHILAATGKPGVGLNQYGEAEEIAISNKNEIYVADKVNDVVQKLIPK